MDVCICLHHYFLCGLEIILNLISPVDYKHEHINKFNKNKLKKTMKKTIFMF